MSEYKINGYSIESKNVYDVLMKHEKSSAEALKKLDKNNDMKITEDELVELLDEDEKNKTNSSDKEDKVLSNYMNQLEYCNEQMGRLEEKRERAYSKLKKCKDGDTSSVLSECQSLTSQIQSIRNQIYTLIVNMEDYQEKKAAQDKALAETETQMNNTGINTASSDISAQNGTSPEITASADGGNYKYSGNSQQFVDKFNNSSFNKGVFNGKGAMVASIAEKYGLDPNLLASIMALETGWGTSNAVKNYNNPGGMMDSKTNYMTLLRYNSLQEGIEAVARNLKNNYINKGLTSISTIGAKYCPVGAANDPNGTNSGWVPAVTSIYNGLTGAKINANTKLV